MRLVILHYHLRPGGIRRVIELATPQLVRMAPEPVTQVVLATGQQADAAWHKQFARQIPGVKVEVRVEPAFNYLSEQRAARERITKAIRRGLDKLLANGDRENHVVWAHNPGVGRNLILARETAAACARRGIPLVAHHHDWWFDNRWTRWPEMRRGGIRTLNSAAKAVFPQSENVIHVAINHADATILTKHLGNRALWLPNLNEPPPLPAAARVRATQRWLRDKLGNDAPVWLLPCRTLRRKNIAEALLLTRWLRPEAWLVVTGGASSAEEQPYQRALQQAAHRHDWRLRVGVLAKNDARSPTVPEMFAASEAALLTSVQEGFGLPYLEAAAAQRPLIARRLPNISPDLKRFGFCFPQLYDEVLIAPGLFDWGGEIARQERLLRTWVAKMPAAVRALVNEPAILAAAQPRPIAFSRLTLTAQLEVLAQPPHESWVAGAALNPRLGDWRERAEAQRLRATPWPGTARSWLSGETYARRFYVALARRTSRKAAKALPPAGKEWAPRPDLPTQIQAEFIRQKLDGKNLHPILWSQHE